jgi:hypothetical protein
MLHINQRANENKHWPPSAGRTEFKNRWRYTSTPYVFVSQIRRIKRAEIHSCGAVAISRITDHKCWWFEAVMLETVKINGLRRLVADLSQRRPGFKARPGRMGFVLGKVALVQGFLVVLRFFRVSIIPPVLHTHISFTYDRRYITLATDSILK